MSGTKGRLTQSQKVSIGYSKSEAHFTKRWQTQEMKIPWKESGIHTVTSESDTPKSKLETSSLAWPPPTTVLPRPRGTTPSYMSCCQRPSMSPLCNKTNKKVRVLTPKQQQHSSLNLIEKTSPSPTRSALELFNTHLANPAWVTLHGRS